MKFRNKIPVDDYEIQVASNAIIVTFTNEYWLKYVMDKGRNGETVIFQGMDATRIITCNEGVLTTADKMLRMVFYLSSSAGGQDMANKVLPFYIVA